MAIKGPDFRNKLEVRRRWKCPACGRETLLPGDQTSVTCSCNQERPLMKLVGEYVPQSAQRLPAEQKFPQEIPAEVFAKD